MERELDTVPSFASLRRFVRSGEPAGQAGVREACELCSEPLPLEHRHLWRRESGRIACACRACALLFEEAPDAPFKTIPRDTFRLPGFRITDAEWNALGLPIGLAFLVARGAAEGQPGRVAARYPSPAGVTESLLALSAWQRLADRHEALARMEPDVQALLVDRTGAEHRYYLAPLDVCYEVAGLLRMRWRGLSGGDDVWREIDAFFERLDAKARALPHRPDPEPKT